MSSSGLLSPGTLVRYDDSSEPEYGVVVHRWSDEEIGAADCYVAFFGNETPNGKPPEKPYILRYAATSLVVLGLESA